MFQKRLLLSLLAAWFSAFAAPAQSREKPVPNRRAKAVYVELLGASITGFSLNYDMRFKRGTNIGWGARIGMGMNRADKDERYQRDRYLPIMIYRTVGGQRAALELGFGTTLWHSQEYYQVNTLTGAQGSFTKNTYGSQLFGNVGLRLQPKRFGPVVRIYWSPIIIPSEGLMPYWAGVSFGFGFK